MRRSFYLLAAAALFAGSAPAMAQQNCLQGFYRLDLNLDGRVTPQEVRAAPLTQFRDLDLNRDNRVSPEEFPGGETAFNRIDANQDGILEPQEIRLVRINLFAAADADGDQTVTTEEVERFCIRS